MEGEFVDFVLVGVEREGGVVHPQIEDEDFAARGADGERHSVGHEIERGQTVIRRDGFQSLTLAGVVADDVVVQAGAEHKHLIEGGKRQSGGGRSVNLAKRVR